MNISSIKYAVYASLAIIISAYIKSAIVSYKNNAVREALNEIQMKHDEITLQKQNSVINQQNIVLKRSQRLALDSIAIDKRISESNTILLKYGIKNELIDSINTNIYKINNLCEK